MGVFSLCASLMRISDCGDTPQKGAGFKTSADSLNVSERGLNHKSVSCFI